ncbi:pilus assembly protein PilM, partial [Candidatus Saccharibacteria bacterium]|nr:pilus assembly protein PilM [Candidatus Saccharibacteria bacterium]
MSILSGVTDFFGLDIGTTGIRLVQLHGMGNTKSLVKYAFTPIDSRIVLSNAESDQHNLKQVISQLVSKAQITTKNVAVGLPSQRVFIVVADMDRLPEDELTKSIHYQIDGMIPTPPSESTIDWKLLG